MKLFPRNDARGAEITEADERYGEARTQLMWAEREERGDRKAYFYPARCGVHPYPPLPSVAKERARLDAKRKTDNWARNHA